MKFWIGVFFCLVSLWILETSGQFLGHAISLIFQSVNLPGFSIFTKDFAADRGGGNRNNILPKGNVKDPAASLAASGQDSSIVYISKNQLDNNTSKNMDSLADQDRQHPVSLRTSSHNISNSAPLRLMSAMAVVYDENSRQPLYSKKEYSITPIASITKLMMAMVLLDTNLPMDELIIIDAKDEDHHKGSKSRIRKGVVISRGDLLRLALAASENRAAAALARTFPGGTDKMVHLMNQKAKDLGMNDSRFVDPTGLYSQNVSTASDLVRMVQAAQGYSAIHDATTLSVVSLKTARSPMRFGNTNPLVRNTDWKIGLSKTGYISESGHCLVMETQINGRKMVIVLLDSWGRNTRIADARRIKQWLEKEDRQNLAVLAVNGNRDVWNKAGFPLVSRDSSWKRKENNRRQLKGF